MDKIIKVRFENEILGDGLFWEGPADRITDIQNIPARMAAQKALKTGENQKFGMWIVEVMGEDDA